MLYIRICNRRPVLYIESSFGLAVFFHTRHLLLLSLNIPRFHL